MTHAGLPGLPGTCGWVHSEGSLLASPPPKGWSRSCTWYKREVGRKGGGHFCPKQTRGCACWRPTPARRPTRPLLQLMQQHAAKFFCMRFHAFLVISQRQETPRVHISWLWLESPVSEPRSHTPRPSEPGIIILVLLRGTLCSRQVTLYPAGVSFSASTPPHTHARARARRRRGHGACPAQAQAPGC